LTHYLPLLTAVVVAASFLVSPRPAATGPVADALKSATSTDRARVRAIYAALADVTNRDAGSRIANVAAWRAVHSDALRLAVGKTDLPGKYPGLDRAVETVLAQHIGLDNLPLSGEVKDKLVTGLKAVERPCE
jgi:hypothetical protein